MWSQILVVLCLFCFPSSVVKESSRRVGTTGGSAASLHHCFLFLYMFGETFLIFKRFGVFCIHHMSMYVTSSLGNNVLITSLHASFSSSYLSFAFVCLCMFHLLSCTAAHMYSRCFLSRYGLALAEVLQVGFPCSSACCPDFTTVLISARRCLSLSQVYLLQCSTGC